ncbi:hypothetical protein [Mesorhizobium sp. B1-1-4]|uniref:hypothetical protein n=1 Tax=Mesorhizobium sp. B1-1-4 TaxID=2589980 RepID=UPI0015E3FC37|nr:hypothetical protein [Mesorhizobium sp. B1-1-4]
MSEARNDGGPAFPSVLYSHERAENWSTDGMSLRDWFAGQALPAIVNATSAGKHQPSGVDVRNSTYSKVVGGIAQDAYALADAMLAARAYLRASLARKNTGEAEPVAWRGVVDGRTAFLCRTRDEIDRLASDYKATIEPLFASPPLPDTEEKRA